MKFLIINDSNINMLGIREPAIYGSMTYKDLVASCLKWCNDVGVDGECFQSNHEGAIVDRIQQAYFDQVDGIVMNPAVLHPYIGRDFRCSQSDRDSNC